MNEKSVTFTIESRGEKKNVNKRCVYVKEREEQRQNEAFFSFHTKWLEHQKYMYGGMKISAFSLSHYLVGLRFQPIFDGNNLNAMNFHRLSDTSLGIYWNLATYRFFSHTKTFTELWIVTS